MLDQIKDAIIRGDAKKATELVSKALSENIGVENILNEGLIAGMNVVGVKFKNNEFYVPEVLIAARAMNQAMAILQPEIVKAGIKALAKVAIGTVRGDLHDIGKNLVSMMWKGAGFEVMDLGIDVPEEKFVEAAKNGAQLIGLSALLTTTMPGMKSVIEKLKSEGIRDKVRVIIGGAPVTQAYADEIGADGYAPDAGSAVDKAKKLLGIK
ncbi:MAG: corrinoid protein [Candidatus Omnitrophica bacterium]|nr:corrinoid protein [Candidatus Omnitrophota bacterium]MCM8825431.1 corrinoid protein [Candidatus Omnitrophota bacterium]